MSVRNPNTLASTIYDKLHLEINKKEITQFETLHPIYQMR